MDSQMIFFSVIALMVLIVLIAGSYFSKKAVVRRKLKKATGKKISDFVSGDIAKVVGKVECIGKPLIAPLSGRPCVYYYVVVEQEESTGKGSHMNVLIEEEVAGTFVIKDGKYYAYISGDYIKSYLVQDREYSSGFLEDATEVLEKYLRDHGQKSEGFLGFNKKLSYREGILEEGELIAVVGRGEWTNADQVHLPDSYRRVLVFGATEEEPIYLSDDPDTVKMTYA